MYFLTCGWHYHPCVGVRPKVYWHCLLTAVAPLLLLLSGSTEQRYLTTGSHEELTGFLEFLKWEFMSGYKWISLVL